MPWCPRQLAHPNCFHEMTLKIRKDHAYVIGVTVLMAMGAMVFVRERGQDLNWDLLNYHFYSGFFLLGGRLDEDLAAAGLQTFFHPAVNLLAYLLLSFFEFPYSAWAILFVQLFSVPPFLLLCRKIARDLGRETVGLAEISAAVLGLTAPLWWSELGTTFFSSTTAPFVLWALYLGAKGVDKNASDHKLIFASGLMLGLASGLKLTNAPFAVAFFMALFLAQVFNAAREAIKSVLVYSSAVIAGFACTSWWYVLLYQQWGSPVFPLYNAIFRSPYFEATNFRDMRWHFASLLEFFSYIFHSAFPTGKTSEIPFADARQVVTLMLGGALVVARKKLKLERGGFLIVLFFFASYALWATAFAYQRYLIPVEFLFGIVIWIFVARLLEYPKIVTGVMLIITLICGVLVRVPDWGHNKNWGEANNAFGLELPPVLKEVPALYLVQGVPNSYIFPFLAAGSKFYRVDFSSKLTALLRERIAREQQGLQIRVLTNHAVAEGIRNTFEVFAGIEKAQDLKCWTFKSHVGSYVVCEPAGESPARHDARSGVVSVALGSDMPWEGAVRGLTGFSTPESWGRWTVAREASIELNRCLPTGPLKISMLAHAYGPNIDEPVQIRVGTGSASASFGATASEVVVEMENRATCETHVQIAVPHKASPFERGESTDTRELGVGLSSLRIEARRY